MSETITQEVFDHLAELAALALDPEEAAYLRKQLNAQLAAIDELTAIPLDDDTALTPHGVTYYPHTSQAVREDVHLSSKDADAILAQAAEIRDRYIVVPASPMEELD